MMRIFILAPYFNKMRDKIDGNTQDFYSIVFFYGQNQL